MKAGDQFKDTDFHSYIEITSVVDGVVRFRKWSAAGKRSNGSKDLSSAKHWVEAGFWEPVYPL